MPVVIGTPSTFPCKCCQCSHVRQLIDCCTNEPIAKAVCEGIGGSVGIKYDGRCYTTSSSTTPFATAISNGWQVIPHNGFNLTEGGCNGETCWKYWQVLLPLCGNNDMDVEAPFAQIAGPCATVPPTSGYVQIGGRWYGIYGYYAQKVCEDDYVGGWQQYGGAGWGYAEIISSTCFEGQAERPYKCCMRCYDHDVTLWDGTPFGPETFAVMRYSVLPCCLQISGMTFSGCGTPTGTQWDGKLTTATSAYNNAYGAAQSYPDPNCLGNWDSCNGYVPGTTVGLPGTSILWYSCDEDVWYLDLAFVSYKKSGGPTTPQGTYTRIGAGSCNAPATLTVSVI